MENHPHTPWKHTKAHQVGRQLDNKILADATRMEIHSSRVTKGLNGTNGTHGNAIQPLADTF